MPRLGKFLFGDWLKMDKKISVEEVKEVIIKASYRNKMVPIKDK